MTLDYVQNDGGSIPNVPITSTDLMSNTVTSGDGLYADEYETGRYVYKGTDPNNYITFNDETWKILSVENDGSLKIMKKDSIGNMAFDTIGGTWGLNNWARPADLNTYLNNDYYNSLSNEAKSLIQTHTWSVGSVTSNNTDLLAQIESENQATWTGNIGLMSLSDFIKANKNTEECGNLSLNTTNKEICKATNYMVPTSGYLWTIAPATVASFTVFRVASNGAVDTSFAKTNAIDVFPVVYLKSGIQLMGEGTGKNPYAIV